MNRRIHSSVPDVVLVATSVLRGRIRWRVTGLANNPEASAALETRLEASPAIHQARANQITGRVLVVFDETLSFEQMEALLRTAVAGVFACVGAVAEREPEPLTPKRAARKKAFGLVTAALGGLSIGAALSLGPLATTALAVASVSCAHVGQKARLRFSGAIAELRENQLKDQIFGLVRPHRHDFVRAIAYNAASNFMGAARIFFLGAAITAIVAVGATGPGFPVFVGLQLPPAALVLIGATLGTVWLRANLRQRSQIAWHQAVSEIQHSARVHLYEHVQQMETAYFQEYQGHQILHALSDDINQFDITGRAVWDLIDVAIYGAFLMGGVVLVGGPLAWLALVPIPIIAGISAGLYPRLRFWHRRVRAEQVQLERNLRDGIDGIITIKSFTAEAREAERIKQLSERYRDERKSSIDANAKLPIVLEFVFQFATTSIYLYSSRASAWTTFRIGSFVALNHFIGTLFFHLANLGPKLDDLERGFESLSHMSRVLGRTPPAGALPPRQQLGTAVAGDIAYRDVHFDYPGNRSVFRGLSLCFQGGKTTAVVGLTGSGKSTLIRLLLRYYEPQRGSIELGGVDLAHVERSEIRKVVSVVDQNIFLFDRSVAENIALHDPNAAMAEIERVAHLAQANQFIDRLPGRYDEMLGERGTVLSGGERQRIAIARSLLKNSPIIVFDEATSSLDSNTEFDLQEQLLPLFSDRTVIIIAHRLSTVRNADHIIVLEDGCCAEQGSHDELIARNGRYRSLWETQFGEAPA